MILTLLITAGLIQAQENELGVKLGTSYVSRYMYLGMDSYPENHSALQHNIDIDLYGTGFGVDIWWVRANSSGFVNLEEIDYILYYYNSLFEGKSYAIDYRLSWEYDNYPNESRRVGDMQEVNMTFSWPNICPAGVVPSYTAVATWPAVSKSDIRDSSGWIHVFGLGYDLAVSDILPVTTEQSLYLSTDIVYYDGAYGTAVDHDWSHAVFGISTEFELSSNLTFTPGLYYQSSWEDSVNPEDEFWIFLGMTYKF